MSRFPPKADIHRSLSHVRFVPIADIREVTCTNRKTASRRSFRNPMTGSDQIEFEISSGALAVRSIYVALNALGRCQHGFLGQRCKFPGLFCQRFKLLTRMAR